MPQGVEARLWRCLVLRLSKGGVPVVSGFDPKKRGTTSPPTEGVHEGSSACSKPPALEP